MTCPHLTTSKNTAIPDDNVFEEEAVAIHSYYLIYYKSSKLQELISYKHIIHMSHPSQIFQVLMSPEEYEQIISEKEKLAKENQELRSQLRYLTDGGEEVLQYPQRIYYLSRKVIQLSKLLIKYKESYEQLKASTANKLNPQAIIAHQKSQILQLQHKLGKQILHNAYLLNQSQQLSKQIQQTNEENVSLKHQIQGERIKQQSLQQQLKQKNIQHQQLIDKIKKSEEEQDQRRIILLNQRNFLSQQSIQLKKREDKLNEAEAALHRKQKQCIEQYEYLSNNLQQKYKKQQETLIEQYNKKSNDLQAEYMKSIASIKQFSIIPEKEGGQNKELSYLREEISKLKEENGKLQKKALVFKKQKQEAVDQLKYVQDLYGNVENIDHQVIKAYIFSLVTFKQKLTEIGEKNVIQKVEEKKNQMLRALQKKIKQTIN